MPGNNRFLIVRTSAMGDIVHALPVLAALRRAHPGARIAWVVESVFAPLLEGHPDLDEVIPVALRTWRKEVFSAEAWRSVARFSEAIRSFSPDVVLDLMGTHKSGILGAWTLADRRLGLARGDRREPSSAIWLSDTVPALGPHAVDRMLSVLSGIGLDADGGSVDFAGKSLPGDPWHGGPRTGESFALLHPETAWRNKNYPRKAWSRVLRLLKERAGIDTWVAWGPDERGAAEEIARTSGSRALEHLSTLPQLTALSREARIVIGGDTGPVHLAHALGTPVVCVMGPTDPNRNGPYGSPERAVVHRLPCSFCHQRLDSAKACLLNIEPEKIVERMLAVLG